MSDLTTKLYFGPWYRRSPFFEATRRAGCKAYDIYNKMYLPAEYDDVAVEYRALQEGVTLHDQAHSAGNVSTALFAIGGAALATGAVLWLTAKPHAPEVGVAVVPGGIALGMKAVLQ